MRESMPRRVARSAKNRRHIEPAVAQFEWQRLWPAVSLATLVIVFTIWWTLTSGLKVIPPLYFPRPESVAERLADLRTVIVGDALWTLGRVVGSWLLGSAMGVTIGLLMIRSRLAFFVLTPLVEALRPVPPIALIPFVAGFSYEIIRLSARKESGAFFKLVTRPGVWLQNITTQEPDDSQLEVALEALKESLKLEPQSEGAALAPLS